ncbi:MAG: AAA family ATPase [Methylococcaceae bacterium]|nr:AAA family ATPase [Methylococcaceae bacterium]
MARRLKALVVKYQIDVPETLYISERPAQLLDSVNAAWVAESIKTICPNPGLVIIDTLHRNMDGDENSSQDIGKFINNLDCYFKPLGVAVLVVHHSGHSDKQRSRGSSSIRAAMDGEFAAVNEDGGITLTCHKAKDFEAFKPMRFTLKQAELDWLDDEGDPLTSVYIEHAGEAKTSTKKRRLNSRDEAILASLSDAIAKHGIEPTAEIKTKFAGFDTLAGKLQKIVNIERWQEHAYKAIMDTDAKTPDAKRMAFKRCRDKLLNLAKTVEYDNYAWRIFE